MEQILQLNAYGLRAAGIDPSDDYYDGEDFDDIERTYSRAAGGALLVGEVAGQVIAMGGIRRVTTEICELLRMRVYPEFQGRGYGKAILLLLEEKAADLSYQRIRLLTGEDQHPAVDLYAKHGYTVTEREIIMDMPSVHMVKELHGV
ncbi:GNAT family N-acetyltransferase [Sphaerisporangium album]|nr:GNAT family N-acetyltransferase [Sphaerisporangium album]